MSAQYALQFGNRPVLLTFASEVLFGRLPQDASRSGFCQAVIISVTVQVH
jgi:hypothetical protein